MKGDNIAARLRVFAAGVLRLCRDLPEHHSAAHISKQLVRAATSGGANYEEARGAESRADFIHKLSIANKELLEARYWLSLARESELTNAPEVPHLVQEATELIAILAASIKTARNGAAAQLRR